MNSSVAVLLVSHDGARWLPAVIDGIRAQTSPAGRVVAVDTGSKDDSASLLAEAFGDVLALPGGTSFPAAVEAGLEQVGDAEWIWILHDDANPDPRALEALLAAAVDDPQADILGPKLREWPSLRRLLELGVTISGTGRRETGLERGEYDQGQHDEVRRVLAVNTAGMLVRRTVLAELGGFDRQLPIFGNDIDFGWRAATAGHRTLVVPQAVVFHAEAAHRGLRRTPLTGRHTHYQERRAALYTLLANSAAWSLPFQVVRLGLGTLLRMIGFVLVRQVGQALDELAALVSIYSSPREILAARRERRGARTADPDDVRRLLAPRWLPYRHGLDFVSDLAAAVTNQAADVAERRRAAELAHAAASGVPRRPVDEEETYTQDSGFLVRFLTNPVAVTVTLFVVLALVGAREAFGTVAGGALAPAPESALDWWRLHLATWHPIGQGTDAPAPAYVLPMALLATALGGSPGLAVSALLVLAVPLSLWGAWRFLRVVGRLVDPAGLPTWLLGWGAATYALIPVVSGAWGEGRLGVVAATVLLPWLAHAGLGFADPEADRRWRAAWRAGLLLALGAAFAPVLFWFALVLALAVVGAGFTISPRSMRDRSVWGPPAVALGVVPVLGLPYWLPALLTGAGPGLLLDAGRLPMEQLGFRELVVGRLGDSGAPWWLGLLLVVLAAAALVPARTRIPVLVCWIVAFVSALLAAGLSLFSFELASIGTGPGLGLPLLALQASFLVAAVLGAQGFLARPHTGSDRPVWWRPAAVLVAGAAVVVPAAGLIWFVSGVETDLSDEEPSAIPAYMLQTATTAPEQGILVVRGDVGSGLTYGVVREDGLTLGEDEVLALSGEDETMTADVDALVGGPSQEAVAALSEQGIEYVVLPPPADGNVASVLDATDGLLQASAEDRSTRAWQVEADPAADAVDGSRSWWRTALLVLQGLAILAVLVLAAPTMHGGRRS
ncbi:glycosyltransferase family 2 protein [Nocardioides sp. GCM10027113]|uniref:glycosyltransferase family 2 protein n=1 Tax=unclassified Nocardioides TaxID=2615069 RepID=UPI003613513F